MDGIADIIKDEAQRKRLKGLAALRGSVAPWLDPSDLIPEAECVILEGFDIQQIRKGRCPQIVDIDELY